MSEDFNTYLYVALTFNSEAIYCRTLTNFLNQFY